ncbi:MAG: VOC family protein [Desulforhopalus sp.]
MLDRMCTHDMAAFALGFSHINVVVPCVEEAMEFYQRVLGFEQAFDKDGTKMDYDDVEMEPFALDAGIMDGKVNVDVRFLKHPQAEIYLELMAYTMPKGDAHLPRQPRTFDMGGPRHLALEVSNCNEVFEFLRGQEGVTMINPDKKYRPVKLDGFPITFFYWIDKYGIQWEMEEGRRVGVSRGIV